MPLLQDVSLIIHSYNGLTIGTINSNITIKQASGLTFTCLISKSNY